MRRVAAWVGLCCLLLACGGGSDKSKGDSGYPESTDGLRKLIGDIVERAEAGKQDEARKLARAMALPDHRAWFIEHFGTPLGEKLDRDYNQPADSLVQLVDLLAKLHGAGYETIVVERFDEPNDPASVAYQHMALEKMKKRASLYSVRMVKPDEARGFHIWSFVYAKGGFRWVGKMTGVAKASASGDNDKNELRLRELEQAKAPEPDGGP